jgi:ABC-2 type transport system permease protein
MVWVMMAILFIMIIGMAILNANKANKIESSDWRIGLTEENRTLGVQIQEAPEDVKPLLETQIKRNKYALDKGVSPNQMNAWKFVELASNLLPFVTLFTLVVASGIVASEFKWGTMKLLLIRPISRHKLLLSKYISVLLFAGVFLVLTFLVSWVIGAILFGVEGALEPYIFSRDKSQYQDIPMITNILITYGLKIITLFVMVTLAFVISILFRSSSFAIGFSVFTLFSGNLIAPILSHFNTNFTKLFLFTHLNLEGYFTGSAPVEGMTFGYSIGILIAYVIFFYFIGWLFFAKRDMT